MATTVVMPQMGFDMQEGTIVRWLKQEGDDVSRGEPIAEIETDKAIVEMEAFATGVLLKTVVGEGQTVPVGQTIAVIGSPGEPLPDLGSAPAAPPETEALTEAPAVLEEAVAADVPAAAEQVRASPLARRLAEERGIDLARISGSGPGGTYHPRRRSCIRLAGDRGCPSRACCRSDPGICRSRQPGCRDHAAVQNAPDHRSQDCSEYAGGAPFSTSPPTWI